MREYSIQSFLKKRKQNLLNDWTEGVYLIGNKTNGKFYIGRSNHVKDRLFTHITGRGNGDVYFDIKTGHEFIVRFYPFDANQFRTINELEYHLIRIYEADTHGYNRQQGSPR